MNPLHLLWLVPVALFTWALLHGGTRKKQPGPLDQQASPIITNRLKG